MSTVSTSFCGRACRRSKTSCSWVNEWHLIDMHALVFVMETTLTLLRSQMSPLDEKLLERLHTTFCSVAGAEPVLKREGNHET